MGMMLMSGSHNQVVTLRDMGNSHSHLLSIEESWGEAWIYVFQLILCCVLSSDLVMYLYNLIAICNFPTQHNTNLSDQSDMNEEVCSYNIMKTS